MYNENICKGAVYWCYDVACTVGKLAGLPIWPSNLILMAWNNSEFGKNQQGHKLATDNSVNNFWLISSIKLGLVNSSLNVQVT